MCEAGRPSGLLGRRRSARLGPTASAPPAASARRPTTTSPRRLSTLLTGRSTGSLATVRNRTLVVRLALNKVDASRLCEADFDKDTSVAAVRRAKRGLDGAASRVERVELDEGARFLQVRNDAWSVDERLNGGRECNVRCEQCQPP
jgi:hypothetical protein